MAKKFFVILSLFIATLSQAGIRLLPDSWQMVGVGFDYNLSRDLPYSADEFGIVWHYEDGKWTAFSKDSATVQLIKDKGLWGEVIPKNSAFWILPKKELVYPSYRDKLDTIYIKPGWNMVGVTNWASNIYEMKDSGLKAFFVYRDKKWKYYYKSNMENYSGDLINLSFSEGGWVYNDTNETKLFKTWTIKHYWETNYNNKKFSFDGKYFIVLDQNGTVLSDDVNLSGKDWYIFRAKDDYISFDIEDNKTLISYYIYKENGSWILRKKYIYTINPLPSHILNFTKQDRYKNLSIPVTISDYHKDQNITEDVKIAMDSLKTLLENGDEDPQSVIDSARSTLEGYSSDNDAKVALAFISLIEVMNDSSIGSSVNINSTGLDTTTFFKALKNYGGDIPDSAIKLAQSISDYNQNARSILKAFATNLEKSADKLDTITDKNYIFNYSPLTGTDKLNYVDIKFLKSFLYLVASKFELISAYDLGDNEWLETKSVNDIQYIKASADPVGFIKSGTFFVSPNQDGLTKAKELLLKALYSYNDILTNHYYDKGLLFSGDNIIGDEESSIKRDVYLAIRNLEGKIPSFCFLDDTVEFDYDNNQYKNRIEKQYINLSSLFDVNSAVKMTDFPATTYSGTWNEAKSYENNSPSDSSGNELDINFVNDPENYMGHLFLGKYENYYYQKGVYDIAAFGYGWYIKNSDSRYYGNKVEKLSNGSIELTAYYKPQDQGSNGNSRARVYMKLYDNPVDEISATFTPREFLDANSSWPKIQLAGSTWIDNKNGGLWIAANLFGSNNDKFCYGVEADIGHNYYGTYKCADINTTIEENHQYTFLIRKAYDNSRYVFQLYDGATLDNNSLITSQSISLSELTQETKNAYLYIYPEDGDTPKAKKFQKFNFTVKNDGASSASSDFKTVADLDGARIIRY